MKALNEFFAALIMLALIAAAATCGVMRWRECRRVHPFWYCAMEK